MKRKHRIVRTLLYGVLFMAAFSGPALASEPEGFPASEWLVDVIDATRVVGYFVSVATDPFTGESYISYYEGIDGDLWLARTGAPTGNCGPGNTWECQVVDSVGVVGKYSSITVGGPGPIAKLYISYYDWNSGSLKVLEGEVNRETGALSYTTDIVDLGDPGISVYKGKRTALAITSGGTPQVAYQVDLGTYQVIKYAKRVAPGTGNCGEGGALDSWQCDSIHTEIGIGDYIDIDVGPGGITNIAFHTTFSFDTFPIIATLVGTGGSCNISDAWQCGPIRNMGYDTGEELSLAIGIGGVKHLAYRNADTDSLEWARYVGSGGNCGPNGNTWQCEWIDDIGFDAMASGIDIETDNDANPIIVYQDVSSGDFDLNIARPLSATPWGPVPNCGPNPGPMYEWYCETLDAGDINHAEAAGGLSIAMNAKGEATVAYRELFGIPPDEGRLKVAIEPRFIFADGFESGTTSGWSAATP